MSKHTSRKLMPNRIKAKQKKKKIQASHFQIEENKEKEKTLEEAHGNNSKWY